MNYVLSDVDFNDGYAVYDAIHEHEITPNKNYKVALSVNLSNCMAGAGN